MNAKRLETPRSTSSYKKVDLFAKVPMPKETQISAMISETTRARLEKHVRATGTKKGHLVEQALLHHLQALEELPTDIIVHPRIVVTRQSFQKVLEQMEKATPTQALRDLMRDGD